MPKRIAIWAMAAAWWPHNGHAMGGNCKWIYI
jgi:hypothetical protein